MNKQVLLATYDDLTTAQHLVGNLVGLNIARSNIGLATLTDGGATGRALVTVTVDDTSQEQAAEALQSYRPLILDTRQAQWRQQSQTGLKPDETIYTAIPRAYQ